MNDIIKAFDIWVELTGIDPSSNSWSSRDWDIRKANDELKRSIELDKTYTVTMLMLDYFLRNYLKSKVFSVDSILSDYDALTKYLAKSKELLSILESEDVTEAKQIYRNTVMGALESYDLMHRTDVLELVDNYHALAFLRRDSLDSLETLKVHQFSQGESSGAKPVYYKEICHFWNINSLIVALSNMKHDGISLNFIEDPLISSSFFVFGIRSGGTITVLSDRPDYVDPDQKYRLASRSRGVARDLYNRVSEHHFPYDILNIEVDDTQRAYVKHSKANGVVPYNTEFIPVKKISDLKPDEILWTLMMFSLIDERFFKHGYKTQSLSYTGEMLVNSSKLLQLSSNSLVLSSYKKIEVPYLTGEDVRTEKVADNYRLKPTGQYDWIEEHYKDQINDDLLNVVGSSGGQLKLMGGDEKELSLVEGVTSFEPTYFGSEEQIQKDHLWIARFNKTKMLQNLADKEFNEREEEVKLWYKSRVEANLPYLLQAVARRELIIPSLFIDEEAEKGWSTTVIGEWRDRKNRDQAYIRRSGWTRDNSEGNILDVTGIDSYPSNLYKSFATFRSDQSTHMNVCCLINDTKASLVATFFPVNAECLRVLTGCESIDELPDVLRNWRHIPKDDGGNHLLQRLDPMDWDLDNPWQKKIDFRVATFLSKSGYSKLRNLCGLDPDKFWERNED
jgi:hypothetical protein